MNEDVSPIKKVVIFQLVPSPTFLPTEISEISLHKVGYRHHRGMSDGTSAFWECHQRYKPGLGDFFKKTQGMTCLRQLKIYHFGREVCSTFCWGFSFEELIGAGWTWLFFERVVPPYHRRSWWSFHCVGVAGGYHVHGCWWNHSLSNLENQEEFPRNDQLGCHDVTINWNLTMIHDSHQYRPPQGGGNVYTIIYALSKHLTNIYKRCAEMPWKIHPTKQLQFCGPSDKHRSPVPPILSC